MLDWVLYTLSRHSGYIPVPTKITTLERGNPVDKTKRNLTKALGVAGASSVVWKKPVIDTVTLPAHAATSEGGFVVDSAVGSQSGSEAAAVCNSEGLGFSVSGTVSAANGQDLAGVSLTIEFTGQRLFEPLTVFFTTNVMPGNIYNSGNLIAVPPFQDPWEPAAGMVLVRFTDQSTYGTSSAVTTTTCF